MFNLAFKNILISFILMNAVVFVGLTVYYKLTEINVFEAYSEIGELAREPSTYHEDDDSTASLALLKKTKEGYVFTYNKSKHIQHAFSAVYFPLEALKVDFSSYDRIEISLKSEKARRIPIQLSMHYGDSLVRYLTSHIEYLPQKEVWLLDLLDFETPEEWYNHHNISDNELPRPNFSNIQTISIESCHLLAKGVGDEYEITGIRIAKSKVYYWYVFFVVNLIFLLVSSLVIFKKKEVKEKIVHIPINQVEVKESNDKVVAITQIENYIANQYSDPELSLKKVENALGLSGVSKELKNKFQLTFPQYVNKVRIEEAKRILMNNKEVSVSEVGYAVGFNSPSNFGRVFKKYEGVSPNEFL